VFEPVFIQEQIVCVRDTKVGKISGFFPLVDKYVNVGGMAIVFPDGIHA
jgi:hypothetical protein